MSVFKHLSNPYITDLSYDQADSFIRGRQEIANIFLPPDPIRPVAVARPAYLALLNVANVLFPTDPISPGDPIFPIRFQNLDNLDMIL
jgi:hypothetical protein